MSSIWTRPCIRRKWCVRKLKSEGHLSQRTNRRGPMTRRRGGTFLPSCPTSTITPETWPPSMSNTPFLRYRDPYEASVAQALQADAPSTPSSTTGCPRGSLPYPHLLADCRLAARLLCMRCHPHRLHCAGRRQGDQHRPATELEKLTRRHRGGLDAGISLGSE